MLTIHEAARRKGCDARTVKRAVEVGDLTLYRGKLREADVDAWEPKRTKPRLAEVEAAARAAEAPAAPGTESAPKLPTTAERMRQIDLERKEQEWARDRGLLIDRAEAVRIFADFGHNIRRELQSHPRKMQAQMVRHIRCVKCGAGVEAKIIAIEAERYVAQLLRLLADNPLGGAS